MNIVKKWKEICIYHYTLNILNKTESIHQKRLIYTDIMVITHECVSENLCSTLDYVYYGLVSINNSNN